VGGFLRFYIIRCHRSANYQPAGINLKKFGCFIPAFT